VRQQDKLVNLVFVSPCIGCIGITQTAVVLQFVIRRPQRGHATGMYGTA